MFNQIVSPNAESVFNTSIREAIADGEASVAKFWEQFGTNKDGRTVEEVEWEKFKKPFCVLMNTSEQVKTCDVFSRKNTACLIVLKREEFLWFLLFLLGPRT